MTLNRALLALAFASTALLAACADGSAPLVGTGGSGTGGDEPTGAGGSECLAACSADGAHVLDCHGGVTMTCPADEVCAEGACSGDPCDIADVLPGAAGCSFWVPVPAPEGMAPYPCLAVLLANDSNSTASVSVEYEGTVLGSAEAYVRLVGGDVPGDLVYSPYDPSVGIPKGRIAVVSLARETAPSPGKCPSTPAIQAYPYIQGTGRGSAFLVRTTAPVTATSIFPFHGGEFPIASGTLLHSEARMARDNIVLSPKHAVPYRNTGFVLVGTKDGSTVVVKPNNAILGGGGVQPTQSGQSLTLSLDRGEAIQILQEIELTGSRISGDAAVGLFSVGDVQPTTTTTLDRDLHAIPPPALWGHRYAAVPPPNRAPHVEEVIPWRIVGVVDNTELRWEGRGPGDAPSVIHRGQVLSFDSDAPFIVESQDEAHPFHLSGTLGGSMLLGLVSDPEWFFVAPTTQYQTSFFFTTDPTFPENVFVITRERGGDGTFADVVLDCLGAIGGWSRVGDYEIAQVDISRGAFVWSGPCRYGPYRLSSQGRFSVTVWGWGNAQTGTESNGYALTPGLALPGSNTVLPVPE